MQDLVETSFNGIGVALVEGTVLWAGICALFEEGPQCLVGIEVAIVPFVLVVDIGLSRKSQNINIS